MGYLEISDLAGLGQQSWAEQDFIQAMGAGTLDYLTLCLYVGKAQSAACQGANDAAINFLSKLRGAPLAQVQRNDPGNYDKTVKCIDDAEAAIRSGDPWATLKDTPQMIAWGYANIDGYQPNIEYKQTVAQCAQRQQDVQAIVQANIEFERSGQAQAERDKQAAELDSLRKYGSAAYLAQKDTYSGDNLSRAFGIFQGKVGAAKDRISQQFTDIGKCVADPPSCVTKGSVACILVNPLDASCAPGRMVAGALIGGALGGLAGIFLSGSSVGSGIGLFSGLVLGGVVGRATATAPVTPA